MQRRDFIKICGAAAALGAQPAFAARDLKPRFYTRALLVDARGQALKTAALAAGRNYIFHYPFEGTPCFLLNLGKPTLQPLSAILLEHDRGSDALYAVGTLGGEMFNAFFEKFGFKLGLDYGADRVKNRVDGQSVVVALESFCKQQVRC